MIWCAVLCVCAAAAGYCEGRSGKLQNPDTAGASSLPAKGRSRRLSSWELEWWVLPGAGWGSGSLLQSPLKSRGPSHSLDLAVASELLHFGGWISVFETGFCV